MRIKKTSSILFLLLTLSFKSLTAFAHHIEINSNSVIHQQKINFRGIYADESSEGIYNPERGLRLEIAVNIAKGCDLWEPAKFPRVTDKLLSESNFYASDSISLVQSYFYLHEYIGRDLDKQAFENMNTYFNELRRIGKKAVLRFAYETGWGADGPTIETVLRHTQQLKPFLEKNKDIIMVVQAGIIGAWGEWHSSKHGLEGSDKSKKNILEHILAMTPENRFLQVRVPAYKNLIAKESHSYQRLSFHDDMIIIKPHQWDGDMHEGSEAFTQIMNESPFLPVDGELPWGEWSVSNAKEGPEAGWLIDGQATARQLFLEHFTSLSAIHNYKEIKAGKTAKYSMMYWKETPISTSYLKEQQMPLSSCYFQKKDGTAIHRSAFDYIRDHLGYRLELQQLLLGSTSAKEKEIPINLSLINRGFSTLFNEHSVCFVLIDSKNKIYEFPTQANVNAFQPYAPNNSERSPLIHHIKGNISIKDLPKGTYRLGLWIPDGNTQLKYNSRYSIRCANGDITWWISPNKQYGINVLSTLKL